MDRKEAKELLPIIQAFAEGKHIQWRNHCKNWIDVDERDGLDTEFPSSVYRIKPEPKYRPFKTQEECWNEMHKHPDFGWLKSKATGYIRAIGSISNGRTGEILITWSTNEICNNKANNIFNNYEFTDGAPFGALEE